MGRVCVAFSEYPNFKKFIRPVRVGLAPVSVILTSFAAYHQICLSGFFLFQVRKKYLEILEIENMKLGDFMDYIYVTCSTDVFMNLASKDLRCFLQDFPSLPIKIENKCNMFFCLNKKL